MNSAGNLHELLLGWREISDYVGVTIRTLRCWQDQLGFPIKLVPTADGKALTPATTRAAINDWLNIAFLHTDGNYIYHRGLV